MADSDSWRIYHLYYYLCGSLAMSRRANNQPNAQKIERRLGKTGFRKIVSALFGKSRAWQSSTDNYGTVTTGSVVNMLSELRNSLNIAYQNHEEDYNRVLTTEDILIALHKLIELTPNERRQLGLPTGDGLTLLQQMLLTLQTAGGVENYEVIFRAYKEAVGINFSNAESGLQNLDQVDRLIAKTVTNILDYLPDRPPKYFPGQPTSPGKSDTCGELTLKAQREIRRLLARSGNTQAFLPSNEEENSYIRHYLQPDFVKKLAETVITNERLTDSFPVYLKRVTMEACGPLPFADKGLGVEFDNAYPALLNSELQRLDNQTTFETVNNLPGPSDYELASQEATKITVEFYIKVPTAYEGVVKDIFNTLISNETYKNKQYRRIDFALSSTGIGGTLSHAIKVINIALLEDIPCLSTFFPIAHDVTSTQTIIRDNVASPVWAHSLVKLCHKQTVGKALQEPQNSGLSYDKHAFGDPIGHGNYCGFDFLLSQVQASLQSRLQAVRNTGVSPETYILELCQRTERMLALREAWSHVKGYPFSSMAMIGTIHRSVIKPIFGERQLRKDDPNIYFDAYLSIAEVLLDEGAYKASYLYIKELHILETYVQQGLNLSQENTGVHSGDFEIFSGTLVIRYLICLATYYYLYDTQNTDTSYLPPGCSADINRQVLIQKAWETLKQAQQHTEVRLKKYIVTSEISQGTFHPHYTLLGRIYFIRAKLLTYFPQFVPRDEQSLPTESFVGQRRTAASIHWGKLYLLEKARLYAAADGNSEVYAYYAAMQGCSYIFAAFEDEGNLSLSSSQSGNKHLSRWNCLDWAKKLRDHALLAYSEKGLQCYYEIKEKSGLPDEHDNYGHYRIDKLPAIYEARSLEQTTFSNSNSRLLTLDLSLLGVDVKYVPKLTPNHPTQNIYLFGTNACYLFFIRGLYLLCNDSTYEFNEHQTGLDIDWRIKLERALRLLDLAWATAEAGCTMTKVKENGESIRSIKRSFAKESHHNQYTSKEIESVQDLYPRRVGEIAALGKLFSAACMVMLLHTVSAKKRPAIARNIENILAMLHHSDLLINKLLRAHLARQKTYDGNLRDYFSASAQVIRNNAAEADNLPDAINLKDYRNKFMKELFAVLIN
ncbi:MAG: hypothetical protein AAF579_15030 [Cyanobacteria bacterium P01_C01_bin.118]